VTAPPLRRFAGWLPLPDLQEVALLLLVVPLTLLVLWRAGTALGRRLADWLPLPDLREVALLLLVVPLALLVLWRAGTALGRRAA
jgi:hypothetical protein